MFRNILGFLTTSIGSYICLYQYKKFKEINQMLEKINKKVDKHITFDENIKTITPFNFETGEVDQIGYEEDSKNIITEKVLKLIEVNNHNFTDEDLTKIINLINQYKILRSEESSDSGEDLGGSGERSGESREDLEDLEQKKQLKHCFCYPKILKNLRMLKNLKVQRIQKSYDKISTPPVREKID